MGQIGGWGVRGEVISGDALVFDGLCELPPEGQVRDGNVVFRLYRFKGG